MQKKIKNLIILLIVLLIIIVVTLIITNNYLNKNVTSKEDLEAMKSEQEEYEKIQADPSILMNGQKLSEVKAEGTYFTLSDVISKYNTYLNANNSEAVYNLLYDKFIKENNISKQSVLQFVKSYEEYKIIQMHGLSATDYGIYYIKIDSKGEISFLMINWDLENDTFSICPINEEKYNEGIEVGIEVNQERIASIEKNEYNSVVVERVNNDNIARKYFYDFIQKILYDTEYTYNNLLDKEYSGINFKDYKEFEEFVKYNIERFENLDRTNIKTYEDFESDEEYELYIENRSKYNILNYSQSSENGNKTYTFKDTYGKYYIFKVTAAMKYTVKMDTYSVPTDEFKTTYNNSTKAQKVVLNIQRFFMGINDKNYGYSYNVLSDAFKANNYPTKNDFVNYARQNFFEENEVEYLKYEEQNGLYIYEIKITDSTKASTEEKAFNIIVKLGSGTDFEMSFSKK